MIKLTNEFLDIAKLTCLELRPKYVPHVLRPEIHGGRSTCHKESTVFINQLIHYYRITRFYNAHLAFTAQYHGGKNCV